MRASYPTWIGLLLLGSLMPADAQTSRTFDVVIVGGTPGGLTAAIAAARRGHRAVVLERTAHLGGLPANGLGATDIATRGCGGGLFRQFVDRRSEEHTSELQSQ